MLGAAPVGVAPLGTAPRSATGANQIPVGPRPPAGGPGTFEPPAGGTMPQTSSPLMKSVPPPPVGAPSPPPAVNANTAMTGIAVPQQASALGPVPDQVHVTPNPPFGAMMPPAPTGSMQSFMQALSLFQSKSVQSGHDPSIPTNKTLYVNNVDDKVKVDELKRDLRAMFENFGKVVDVIAMKSYWRRGQAWVIFHSEDEATKALESLQGFPYNRKQLRINYALSKSDVFTKADGTFVPREAGPRKPRAIVEREKQLQVKLQEMQNMHQFQQQQFQQQQDEGGADGEGSSTTLPFKLTSQQQAFASFFQQQQKRKRVDGAPDPKPLLELPTNAVRIKPEGDSTTGFSSSTQNTEPQSQAAVVAEAAAKAAAAMNQRMRALEGFGGADGTSGGMGMPGGFPGFSPHVVDPICPTKKLKSDLMGLGFGAPTLPQKAGGRTGSHVPHHTLIVTDLPDDCLEFNLEYRFRGLSGFKELRYIAGRCLAFVEFESTPHASAAMSALQGVELQEGSKLKISYANR